MEDKKINTLNFAIQSVTCVGFCPDHFIGGNLASLGVCMYICYVFVYPASIQTAVLLIYGRRKYG